MKNQIYIILGTAFLAATLLISCTDTSTNAGDEEMNEEELMIVRNVIGEALSGRDEGFISSLYDLTATVEQDRLNYPNDREWRGPHNNWNYSYNPENGVHRIQYRRGFSNEQFSRMIQVLLQYVFEDAQGNFIELPAQQSGDIETIRFRGSRSGQAEGPVRQSDFERQTNWFLEGFNDAVMSLNGTQTHSGSMSVTGREGRTMMRAYQMEFQLSDITIERPEGETDLIEALVTGLIEYTIHVRRNVNGEAESNTYTGTIELDGGEALLRIMGLQRVFFIDLETGNVSPGRG